MNFFKEYQLRWLFYRILPNMVFGKNDYTADKRCSICKKGCGGLKLTFPTKDGYVTQCPHCTEKLIEEPNISFVHKFYTLKTSITKVIYSFLDCIHIVRTSYHSRYDMFGDEDMYVEYYEMDFEKGITTPHLKPRKWWQYIFIKRK